MGYERGQRVCGEKVWVTPHNCDMIILFSEDQGIERMKNSSLLNAAPNPRKMIDHLKSLLDHDSQELLEEKLNDEVISLQQLGENFLKFAMTAHNEHWRHIISRLYYSAYHYTKAIKLHHSGQYSTDITEHKKIVNLPGDFPKKDAYSLKLSALRSDRNLCDYDHTISINDLAQSIDDWKVSVKEFSEESKTYLRAKGLLT